MTDAELDAVEARANRASPGPWASVQCGEGVYIEDADRQVVANQLATEQDGIFIIYARSEVPELVAELRAAREKLKAAEALMSDWRARAAANDLDRGYWAVQWNECADELEAGLRGGE